MVRPPAFKELQFFTHRYSRGESWYRSKFPLQSSLRRADQITGEASPEYMRHAEAAVKAAELIPDAAILAILRNPIDRAHSHFHLNVKKGHESRAFADVIEFELENPLYLELNQPSPVRGEGFRLRYAYLSGGRYMDHLVPWVEAFGRQRIHVICAEEYFSRPVETMDRVSNFLGLPPTEVTAPVLNAQEYEPMSSSTRSVLQRYYEPHNGRLFDFLARELPWN